jgi:glycine/D-amino acid oxidase-like deaminating enzyme
VNVAADFLVIGSGIAGLRAALSLADAGHVVILTKADPRGSRRRSALMILPSCTRATRLPPATGCACRRQLTCSFGRGLATFTN